MNESTCNVDGSGNKRWTNPSNQYHRVGGPAIEYANGDKAWYIHDKRHRIDGPAMKWANGIKEYWYKGEMIAKKRYYSEIFQIKIIMEE